MSRSGEWTAPVSGLYEIEGGAEPRLISTETNLSAFAPAECGRGHSLAVGPDGNLRVSWMTCSCAPAMARPADHGRPAFGHIKVQCAACGFDAVPGVSVFYDPPHEETACP